MTASWLRKWARRSISPALGLLACIAACGWMRPGWIWLWKVELGAQVFGHWLAMVALFIGFVGGLLFRGRGRLTIMVAASALAAVLMLPALETARHTPDLSWSRAWMPWLHPVRQGRVDRCVFWEGGSREPPLYVTVYHAVTTGRPPPAPWVLVLHTGGWDGGDAGEFSEWHRELAAHGVAVLAMDYRLAPGHTWPAQREDVRHAVDWARAHAVELGIDPEKLFLMGRSAGGQIAAACAYGLPELKVKGLIAFYSPFDMHFAREYARSDDILDSLDLLRQYLGGDPEQVTDNYHTASAIDFVSPRSPPTLLVHGALDGLVWVEQSRRLTAKLTAAGVPHTYIELHWASHGCDYFPAMPGGQMTMQATLGFIANQR